MTETQAVPAEPAVRPWQWPFYPLLLALGPVAFMWSARPDPFRWVEVALQCALYAGISGLILALHARRLGPWRAALATTLLTVGLLFPLQMPLPFVFLGLSVFIWFLPASRRSSADVTVATFLNGLGVTVLLSTVGMRAFAVMRQPEAPPAALVRLDGEAHPDIWWFVLDGYARADWLASRFGVDDRLGPELAARGFQVPARSRANYGQTLYAVTAALNLNYIQDALPNRASRGDVEALVSESSAAASLRAKGYRLVYWPGGLESLSPGFDVEGGPGLEPSEATLVLLDWLLPVRLFERASGVRIGSILRHRFVTGTLARVVPESGGAPTLNLVHVMSPHPPFVVEASGDSGGVGGASVLADGSKWNAINPGVDYRTGYAGQATWLAPQVVSAVDRLLAPGSRPAVVIVSSDHGSRMDVNWDDPAGVALADLLSCFWAIHLPNPPRTLVPDEMSPVNTFRYVFAEVFDAPLSLLPDRSFRQTWNEPEQMDDVTAQVHP